ncbi:hypothetical protein TRVA0_014S01860 [Trichomonascus vanleenenianus]|uniref:LYR motif-containing protein 2 n=1 Tax=Trichomonascus vanleenenianus TaxID=2268995 RepID=UPI003ECA4425
MRLFHSAAILSRKKLKPLSLDYFVQVSQARLLWRFIVRICYQMPPTQRAEMLSWARYEFERHRNETDPTTIKYLVAMGAKEARAVAKSAGVL